MCEPRSVWLALNPRLRITSRRTVLVQRSISNGEDWFLLPSSTRKPNVITMFSSEFNHVKQADGTCALVPGTTPLPDDDSCKNGESYWYERTPYRLIPYSSCVGGYRQDHGKEHICPGFGSKSGWFWMFMILIPFAFTALVGYYYYRRSGMARG